MAKLKPFLFWGLVSFIGLLVGFLKVQNSARVFIDNLFTAQPFDMALGDALVSAFFVGAAVGALLMAVHWGIQKLECKQLRRQVESLQKQLEKARELNSK